MTESTFKRIVGSFADHVDWSGGTLTMELRDEIKEIDIKRDQEGTQVCMDGEVRPAEQWIFRHLAKLDLLARRIRDLVKPPTHFVAPSGVLLDNIDEDPEGNDQDVPDAAETMRSKLDQPVAGATSVLYLTSEAGEGKTSLIDKVAVLQAEAFLNKTTKWLLLPVPLGGRPFLRFDDAVIAALVNRLRFPYWYYDAFLELVRMGAVVPAFDGFEEMIEGTHSEEARSAFKNLVGELESEGSLLVAARRAFFDLTFGSQARLWKSVTLDNDVILQRLSLNRWDKKVFVEYARSRKVTRPERLHEKVTVQLRRQDHPVLTRAVLVKRLIDVALNSDDLSDFLARIGKDETSYFHEFVEGIVKREVQYKWVDRSGAENDDLLTLAQHHELLAMIAYEMWLHSVEMLGLDVVALVVEVFAEQYRLSRGVVRQVQKRITDHSLLNLLKQSGREVLAFDHDDFRSFYLGQALGSALITGDQTAISQILDANTLTTPVIAEATRVVRQSESASLTDVLNRLSGLLESALAVSYIRENCTMLELSLLHDSGIKREIDRGSFTLDALAGRHFSKLTITDSFFAPTRLNKSRLHNCIFRNCRFERLVVDGRPEISGSVLKDCRIDSLAVQEDNDVVRSIFDPIEIQKELEEYGFRFDADKQAGVIAEERVKNEHDLDLTLKFMSMYLRATSLPEQTIRLRLGASAGYFMNKLLPQLHKKGIVGDFARSNRRMKLMVPIDQIERANRQARGSFDRFMSAV